LNRLPEGTRLPLILFYREGHSIAAVAEAMELSEDAVKQRLARGRAALRDRMSALTESVLGRSRPSAVFTFSVMAAIGALAAPAALAATAFAATAAASSASAATITAGIGEAAAPILPVMTLSKPIITAAAALALAAIPAGYQVRGHFQDEDGASNRTPAVADAGAIRASKPRFSESALFAEWRRLHEVHGSTPESMPALYQAITAIKDSFRRRAFRAALLAEWVEVDPFGALAFFRQPKADGSHLEQVMREWMRRDAATAIDALIGSGAGWEKTARSLLGDIARVLPARLGAIAAAVPKPDSYWDRSIRDAFTVAAKKDLRGMREAVEHLEGPNRDEAMAGVAAAWGELDGPAALDWAKSQPPGAGRDEMLRNALIGWARTDPLAALERADAAPPGTRSMYYASDAGAQILKEAARRDFDATLRWLQENPVRLGPDAFQGLTDIVSRRLIADPHGFLDQLKALDATNAMGLAISNALLNDAYACKDAVWDWLQKQDDSMVVLGIRASLLRSAAWKEPDRAMAMMEMLPDDEAGRRLLAESANSLINQGVGGDRLDGLLAKASPRLRPFLIEAGFSLGSAEPAGDLRPWLERLDELPADRRGIAISSLAGRWAAHDPEAAAQWAAALSDPAHRESAIGSLAGRWAQSDSYEASQWIASLSPGPERDTASWALVNVIAKSEPDSAWTWAQSIADPGRRLASLGTALDGWRARDPEGARRAVETSSLAPRDISILRARLDQPPADSIK
jgi:hypothetical protein